MALYDVIALEKINKYLFYDKAKVNVSYNFNLMKTEINRKLSISHNYLKREKF